jgi:hypothetical protein
MDMVLHALSWKCGVVRGVAARRHDLPIEGADTINLRCPRSRPEYPPLSALFISEWRLIPVV